MKFNEWYLIRENNNAVDLIVRSLTQEGEYEIIPMDDRTAMRVAKSYIDNFGYGKKLMNIASAHPQNLVYGMVILDEKTQSQKQYYTAHIKWPEGQDFPIFDERGQALA